MLTVILAVLGIIARVLTALAPAAGAVTVSRTAANLNGHKGSRTLHLSAGSSAKTTTVLLVLTERAVPRPPYPPLSSSAAFNPWQQPTLGAASIPIHEIHVLTFGILRAQGPRAPPCTYDPSRFTDGGGDPVNEGDPSGLCPGEWYCGIENVAVSTWHHVYNAWNCLESACYITKQGAGNFFAGIQNTINYLSGLSAVPIPYPCYSGAYDLGVSFLTLRCHWSPESPSWALAAPKRSKRTMGILSQLKPQGAERHPSMSWRRRDRSWILLMQVGNSQELAAPMPRQVRSLGLPQVGQQQSTRPARTLSNRS